MKTLFLIILIIMSLLLCSCAGHTTSNTKSATQQTTKQGAHAVAYPDKIIYVSVTDKSGVALEIAFNNAKKSAILHFRGAHIDVKQDTTASGIHYSNQHYDYREWHGEIELEKDGKVVFQHQ